MTVRQLAKAMGYHVSTVYNLVKAGKITSYRLNKAIRFKVKDVENWKELLTPKEVAQMTGLHINTVYNLVKNGSIKSRRLGKKEIRFHIKDVENWFDSCRIDT